MANEILVKRAKELVEANDAAVRRIQDALRRAAPWADVDPRTGRDPLTAELVEIARAFVALAEPEWLPKPDTPGPWFVVYKERVEVVCVTVSLDRVHWVNLMGASTFVADLEGPWLKIQLPKPPAGK